MNKMKEKLSKEEKMEKVMNSSFLDLKENLDHDKRSTNLDSNTQEMGILSEREALRDDLPTG